MILGWPESCSSQCCRCRSPHCCYRNCKSWYCLWEWPRNDAISRNPKAEMPCNKKHQNLSLTSFNDINARMKTLPTPQCTCCCCNGPTERKAKDLQQSCQVLVAAVVIIKLFWPSVQLKNQVKSKFLSYFSRGSPRNVQNIMFVMLKMFLFLCFFFFFFLLPI